MDRPEQELSARKLRPHEVPARIFGADTSPEVERFLLAAYRRMSGAEKLERVWSLNRLTLGLALADIRQHYPDADHRELLLRLAVRRYGAAFVRERIGWDVEKAGK